MEKPMFEQTEVVLCEGLRTPIGHIAKSLSTILPEFLLADVLAELMKRTGLEPQNVDGVFAGWVGQGSHAPNISRIAALRAGIPERTHAATVQCNCVSGMEAISMAARRIVFGEGDLFLAGGTESMSTMPFAIRGPRSHKLLRSMDALKQNWNDVWCTAGVYVADCIEEGLHDPFTHTNMAETAEICAQRYGISRKKQDEYAHETFRRCLQAEESGFYSGHVMPYQYGKGKIIEKDEYIYLRRKLVEFPEMIAKAPYLFQRSDYPFSEFYKEFGEHIARPYDGKSDKPTVTLFNSCARSDAAAVVIVTTRKKAKELGLKIMAKIRSWSYCGFDPARMGVAPAYAADEALRRAGLEFDDMEDIELHEAFAATVLSAFQVGEKEFGHKWKQKWEKGICNPNGGSIPLGHPLAATGTRLVLNLIYKMNSTPSMKLGMVAACAAGGIGGAMILEKA
jgi:acetyl-CoA C-acetyltransferase